MITAIPRSLRRRLLQSYHRARPVWYALSPRYRRPSEPVPVSDLISPLRFDIMIRAEMFDFLEAIPAAERGDHVAVARLARTLRYATWFREIAANYVLGASPTEAELDAAFADRVRKTIQLFEQFERIGLDRRWPITLVHHDPMETATGKRLRHRLQPVDGCHRLALLWRSGITELPVDACWVFAEHAPAIDNTRTLLQHVPIELNDYYRFIGLGYVSTPVDGRASLLQAVSNERGPDVLAEVVHLLAADEPLVGPLGRLAPP